MKNMKRAIRRHHYERLKAKRHRIMNERYWFDDVPEEQKKLIAAIEADTPKRQSSCLCCGNPRKHLNETTLQEYRNLISFEEEIGSWREQD